MKQYTTFFFFIMLLSLTISSENHKHTDTYDIEYSSFNNKDRIDDPFSCYNATGEIKIGYDIQTTNADINPEKNLIDILIKSMTFCKQLTMEHVAFDPKVNKKTFFKDLANKEYHFYIIITLDGKNILWKLYEMSQGSFITGRSYLKENYSNHLIARSIGNDIWKELFSVEKTPFNSFLVFLSHEKNNIDKNQSYIYFTHPSINEFSKKLLKTNKILLDLSIIPSKPFNSILIAEKNLKNVGIAKLDAQGEITKLIDIPGNSISPTVNNDGMFYINNGRLYLYYFNNQINAMTSFCLDHSDSYASIVAAQKKKELLVARKNKIYAITYNWNPDNQEFTIEKTTLISGKNAVSGIINEYDDCYIISEKIDHWYQLVAYKDKKRKILTHSPFHKQDPTLSPCGNYIAYVRQNNNGERHIEVYNIYTGITKKITEKSGSYVFPVWLER